MDNRRLELKTWKPEAIVEVAFVLNVENG